MLGGVVIDEEIQVSNNKYEIHVKQRQPKLIVVFFGSGCVI